MTTPAPLDLVRCRCRWLNTLTGTAALDYVQQHLDPVREDARGRRFVRCTESGSEFVLEPSDGVYGGEGQVKLRRAS